MEEFFKHTPGPWKAVEEFEGWAVIKVEKRPVIGKQYVAMEINQGHDIGEADAILISAAPFMIKALVFSYLRLQKLANATVKTAIETEAERAGLRNVIAEALNMDIQTVQEYIERKAVES